MGETRPDPHSLQPRLWSSSCRDETAAYCKRGLVDSRASHWHVDPAVDRITSLLLLSHALYYIQGAAVTPVLQGAMGHSGGGVGGVGSGVRREKWGRLWLVWKASGFWNKTTSPNKEIKRSTAMKPFTRLFFFSGPVLGCTYYCTRVTVQYGLVVHSISLLMILFKDAIDRQLIAAIRL